MEIFDIIKSVIFGIVEGITEWLPISSTGHMILLNEILPLRIGKNPDDFTVCLRWLSSLEPFWRLLFVLEPDLAIRQEE